MLQVNSQHLESITFGFKDNQNFEKLPEIFSELIFDFEEDAAMWEGFAEGLAAKLPDKETVKAYLEDEVEETGCYNNYVYFETWYMRISFEFVPAGHFYGEFVIMKVMPSRNYPNGKNYHSLMAHVYAKHSALFDSRVKPETKAMHIRMNEADKKRRAKKQARAGLLAAVAKAMLKG